MELVFQIIETFYFSSDVKSCYVDLLIFPLEPEVCRRQSQTGILRQEFPELDLRHHFSDSQADVGYRILRGPVHKIKHLKLNSINLASYLKDEIKLSSMLLTFFA